jgi:hypothetical protein
VSAALGRLRFGVNLCCWIVGLALITQIVVWSLVRFTDLRFSDLAADAPAPLIVKKEVSEAPSALDAETSPEEKRHAVVNPNRVPGAGDRFFALLADFSSGFGALSVLALAPLLGLGVLLAASSATEGVERTVSAFGWALVVGLLVMPIGEMFGMPWQDGALWSYETLTAEMDGRIAETAGGKPLGIYARYIILPLTCLFGIALVAQRFNSGIRAGAYQKESFELDPVLEAEAANVKPGSHHGSRAAAAMRSTMTADGDEEEDPARKLSTRVLPQGSPPRRLI